MQLATLLRKLAEDYPLVLVGHDMDAVFSIADVVLASGPMDQIRADAAVQEAPLGDGEEAY